MDSIYAVTALLFVFSRS